MQIEWVPRYKFIVELQVLIVFHFISAGIIMRLWNILVTNQKMSDLGSDGKRIEKINEDKMLIDDNCL